MVPKEIMRDTDQRLPQLDPSMIQDTKTVTIQTSEGISALSTLIRLVFSQFLPVSRYEHTNTQLAYWLVLRYMFS